MEDARTTARWYLCVSMGRKSGSLALGMCKAAGATLAVIPEEFRRRVSICALVVDTIVGSIVKRRAVGHDHGVAIVAEGIAERLTAERDRDSSTASRATHTATCAWPTFRSARVARRGRKRLDEIGVDMTVVNKDIGYELRCAKPVPFDVEYTRTLGYGAVRYLLGGGGALIALTGGRVTPGDLDRTAGSGDGPRARANGRRHDRSIRGRALVHDPARTPGLHRADALGLAAQTQLSAASFKARFMASALV